MMPLRIHGGASQEKGGPKSSKLVGGDVKRRVKQKTASADEGRCSPQAICSADRRGASRRTPNKSSPGKTGNLVPSPKKIAARQGTERSIPFPPLSKASRSRDAPPHI